MKRRQILSRMVAFALPFFCVSAPRAQAGARKAVVGLLDGGERLEWWDAFRQHLRELGYVEGRNVSFEVRYAKGNLDALPGMASELARLNVDLIVTSSTSAAFAAEHATRTIPIVMASGGDQVSRGLAASLARPGGNVTGVTSLTPDLMGKRLELPREIAPKNSRVAALWHADNTSSMASVRELDGAATRARVAFQRYPIRDAAELPKCFRR